MLGESPCKYVYNIWTVGRGDLFGMVVSPVQWFDKTNPPHVPYTLDEVVKKKWNLKYGLLKWSFKCGFESKQRLYNLRKYIYNVLYSRDILNAHN